MSTEIQTVYDATHENIAHLPAGIAFGYTTGRDQVPWTAADWRAHPGAVRCCQDPVASDRAADLLDIETDAATVAVAASWARAALAAFHGGARPGQRSPAIYCSRSRVTEVVNALIAGGVTEGIGLWIADWDNNATAAAREVAAGSGPFPVIGRQYHNAGLYDVSAVSTQWLTTVSVGRPDVPPGQWLDSHAWTWVNAVLIGTGLDGKIHSFKFDPAIGDWARLA